MTAPLLINGLWRGIAVAFAHAEGQDPNALLALSTHHVPRNPIALAACRMRQRATYVAVAGFGVPSIVLAHETGISKQAISKVLRQVEDCRDDPLQERLIVRVADLFGVQI